MEGLLLLLVIVLIIIVVVPIVTLVKISSINSRLTDIEQDIKQLRRSGIKVETVVKEEIPVVVEKAKVPEDEPIYEVVKEPAVVIEEDLLDEEVMEEIPVTPPVEVKIPEPVYYSAEKQEQEKTSLFTMDKYENDEPPVKTESPLFRIENLLSKIGIVTLVLGIAFFVKYAIDKDWINEIGRVAIGILTGGILIGIAHKLREKYNLFSAIMVGGGISTFYITITLAFREYQLFDQTLAFGILIAITIFSVILSLVYDRKELALFSLLGGFASPLMISTGEGNYVVLFSFLFILNSGMLIISMRKKWGIIGLVSFICTQLFYWTWLLTSFEKQYTGALIFAILFFVQFYMLALFDHFLSGKKISPFQVGVILANNLSMFAASIVIFNDVETKINGLITIAMAVINAIVMVSLYRKVTVDKRLIYLIIAIVLSFVSLAIPVQLNGHVITMFWAAEIVILLWLWKRSGIKVFYYGFLSISALTLVSYIMDAYHIYNDQDMLPVVFNRICMTGLVVIAAFTVSRFLYLQHLHPDKLSNRLTWIIALMSYLVPFLEILYQFGTSPFAGISDFTAMMIACYTTIYIAVLTFIFRKKIPDEPRVFVALFAFVLAYLVIALPVMIDLREHVFHYGTRTTLFLTHYLPLPALAYIFYILAKSSLKLSRQAFAVSGWLLVASAVVILSVELDSTIIQLWGTPDNYADLLYDVHTFGYPILWGILAMILMVWGLKAREALLRQISLGFFAFIILKFYTTDIWLMSQTGRIISFVVLGIILLSVSFLIQKIKMLIKDDDEDGENKTDKL